jgi:peptidylprolyl isomerase
MKSAWILALAWLAIPDVCSFFVDRGFLGSVATKTLQSPSQCEAVKDDGDSKDGENILQADHQRRKLLLFSSSILLPFGNPIASPSANAANLFQGFQDSPSSHSLYILSPLLRNATMFMGSKPVDAAPLTSEMYMLKLLPVKNPLFRRLVATLDSLSILRNHEVELWKKSAVRVEEAIVDLDNKRSQLEPVFNPDDATLLAISKGERCEQLVESLRKQMVELVEITKTVAQNTTRLAAVQKLALLNLNDIGELLVPRHPYEVPTEGKFSYLPRLQGRARVTFSFRRGNKVLGNVTIIADGYTAPITAGNFVDLAIRNFYTGLPIKFSKKRLASATEFEVANVPILGSFQEGFFDPLTAKLRRIPLEVIRVSKSSGVPVLTYAPGLASVEAPLEPAANSRPLVTFETAGVVAMNHPERCPNCGSSEFFALQGDSIDQRRLLDGEYAPFGYIVEGYELFQRLEPNDVIDHTNVDEWGELNLVKLRKSSFSEVVQGSEADANETESESKT